MAIVGVFLIFFVSGLVFKPEVTVKSTKIGTELQEDTRTITLVESNFYPDNETLVFSFLSPVTSTNVLEEVKVDVKKDRTDKTKYDVQLKQINEELYVVKICNLSDDWDKFSIGFYSKTTSLDSLNDNQKLHFARKEVTTKDAYNASRSNNSYELSAVKLEIDQAQKKMRSNAKKETNKNKSIKKIETVNKKLSVTLDEKTDKEKEDIQQTIDQNKSQIETIEKEISTLKENDQELNSKLNNMNDRKDELQNS